jgi:hypothetical protein
MPPEPTRFCDGRETVCLHWGPVGASRRAALLIVAVLTLAGGGIAAGLVLTEGGGSSGSSNLKARYAYPQAVKNQFLAACETHSEKSVCDCVVRAYEATMPYGIYQDITRGGVRLNNRVYYAAFTQAASRCLH